MALLFAAVVFGISPFTKWYVEKNCKELTGRLISIGDIDIDILSGRITTADVVMYEPDDTTNFVAIGRFDMSIALGELMNDHILVEHARLVRPDIRLAQEGARFNFDDLVTFIVEQYLTGERDEESEPWRITLQDLAVENGRVTYYDREIDQQWRLSQICLSTPSVVLGDTATWVDASMTVNDHAPVEGRLSYNYLSGDYTFEGTVDGFDLADTYKYLTPYVNTRRVGGTVAARIAAEGNIYDPMASTLRGRADISDMVLDDPYGSELFACGSLGADIAELNLAAERYIFESVKAQDYRVRYTIDAEGKTNVDPLFYHDPQVSLTTTERAVGADGDMYHVTESVSVVSQRSAEPIFGDMVLRIGTLDLRGGRIRFEDNAMHKPFGYSLRNVEITSSRFDLAARNTVMLRAGLQKQGSAVVRWEGSLEDFHNQNLLSVLNNVDMSDFSPYCEHYTAFPIESGNLTFRSQNIIVNGYLKGVNHLDTYNFAVGKKDKSIDAEFGMPLRMGIFILTDRKKHIDIDLPVTGSIDSPEFSYRKIIMKGIGNLMLKVVAAPFAWMGSGKQDVFRYIDIDALALGFDSEQYGRFDSMAEELKAAGDLKIRVVQRINYDKAVRRLAHIDMNIAYYNSTQAEPGHRLDLLDLDRIAEMKLSARQVAGFADSQLLVKGIDPSRMSVEQKAMALYGGYVDAQLQRIMDSRSKSIREYMAFQHADLPEGAFTVNAVTVEDIRNYRGKDRYTVTLIVDEEETEIVGEEDDEADDTEYVSEGGEDSQSIIGDADAAAERTQLSVTEAADTALPAQESESESESVDAAALPDTASAGSDERIAEQPAEQIERPERALQPEGVADACREEIAAQSEAAAEVVQDEAAVLSEGAAETDGELSADSDIAPQQ